AAAAGVSGLLLTDFPAGADPALEAMVQASPLALIRLIAPTTTPDRLTRAVRGASGFLYLISRLVVTGVRDQVPADLAEHAARVRAASAIPLAVGFGMSTPAQASATALLGDGFGADWLWQKKMFLAALVNVGREVIALLGAYGVYAGAVRLSSVTTPGLHVELIPALFFFCLAYFVISRLLFYFALVIRGKL